MKWSLGMLALTGLILGTWLFWPKGIAGSDRNQNGVRDDVEEHIKTIKHPKVRLAASQLARSYQNNILNPKTPYEPAMKAVSCLFRVSSTYGEDGLEILSDIQSMMGNTTARREALIKYSSQFNGKILFDQDHFGNPCAFEP